MAQVLSCSVEVMRMDNMCNVQAANITDQDIDAIIQKGLRATDELNEKMKQYSENAKAFTLDGGFTAYEYKDDDDMPDELPNFKQLAGDLSSSESHFPSVQISSSG